MPSLTSSAGRIGVVSQSTEDVVTPFRFERGGTFHLARPRIRGRQVRPLGPILGPLPVRNCEAVMDRGEEMLTRAPLGGRAMKCLERRGLAREVPNECHDAPRGERVTPQVKEIEVVIAQEVGFDSLAVLR